MKKTIFILGTCCIAASAFKTDSNNCGDSPLFKQGVHYTMTQYDANGKLVSTNASTVNKILSDGAATSADITTISTHPNDKNQKVDTVNFQITCSDGKIIFDMRNLIMSGMNQSKNPNMKDVKMTLEGTSLAYPTHLAVGDKLSDGTMIMKMTKDGSLMSTTTMNFHDRSVLAEENKTTAGGTWDCYKITTTVDSQSQFGTMNIPGTIMKTIEWFSPKVGMVRSETWRGDKMMGYSELTSISIP